MFPRREPSTEEEKDLLIGRRALRGSLGGTSRRVAPVRVEPSPAESGKSGRKYVVFEPEASITGRGHPYISFDPDGTF